MCWWHHIFKGSKILYYWNQCFYGSKMRRIIKAWRDLFPSACLSGQEWKEGTRSSPLRRHSSDAFLYLLAPSPPRHLVPIPTEITVTSAASISPVAWPSVVAKDCVAHFLVIWIDWGGLPRSAAGIALVYHLNLWNRYPSQSWKHETWGESSQQRETDHDYWRWRVKGQDNRAMC